MMDSVVELLTHKLRFIRHEGNGQPINMNVIYDPEHETVKIVGQGGSVNFESNDTEKVIELLQRTVAIREVYAHEGSDETAVR